MRYLMSKLLAAAAAALMLPAPLTRAAEPTPQPLLRLETGMHTAMINRIATDRDGRWAVTASDDKTARLWDVATGQPAGVLRPPQDEGNEGKLYAVAMSPDGATVAVGGWSNDNDIYLFDRATQQLRRRIPGLPNVILHLAWAPNGRWLAASLGGANGVRIFDTTSGTEVGRDTDFKDVSYSVEFSPSGSPGDLRLLSTSYDGQVRLHAVAPGGALCLLRAVRPGGGERPFAARFSPDGGRVAVGYTDSRVVQVLDAADLSDIARPDVTGVGNGDLSSVAWSADGRSLVAAGSWDVKGKLPLRRWSAGDWRPLGDVPLAGDTVMGLVALPTRAGGGWLFAGSDPTWGVLGADGQVLRQQDAVLADLRGQLQQLQFGERDAVLRFGYLYGGKDAHRFDVVDRALRADADLPTTPTQLVRARTVAPGLDVKDWRGPTQPTLNGQPLKLQPYERSRSLAITPDGQRFVLGTAWRLRCFDRLGEQLWEQAVPGVAWAVNVSADGRWVVAGYGDGTIRWHRMENGKEVMAFFPHANRQDWVLWTPEGFYAASPGAENLIGYHVNQGKDREGEFISAAQLRQHFYSPALVSARLGPEGDRLMADAVARLGQVQTLLANARNVPPAIELVTPDKLEGETDVVVTFKVQERGGGGVGALKYYVDGVPVEGRQTGVAGGQTVTRTFALAPGAHRIEVAATSRGGVEGPRQAVLATLTGARQATTLHILAVGVETYQDTTLQLKHSVSDAQGVADELVKRAKPVFGRVAAPRVLKNEQATLAGIQQAFREIKAQMRPDDTLVLFLAGHGEARVGTYTYLPWDFKRGAPGALGEGLNEARLFQMLDQSPAKTLLLIDSCDAGGMVELFEGAYERMGNVKKRAVIGASRRGELAREGYRGHGVFSAALLRVLARASDGEDLSVPRMYDEVKSGVTRISREMGGSYRQTVKGYLGTADFPVVRR